MKEGSSFVFLYQNQNMAGIYIHIPFCKQACHYCDFHFSTSLKKKPELVQALCRELQLRREEIQEPVETIYLGGGTPSLLDQRELELLFQTIQTHYKIVTDPEITLEANPDDLSPDKIRMLATSSINRLSIGIQSFFDADLELMNRAHNRDEALKSIEVAKKYFDNISIDLIYGIPGMDLARWEENLNQALALDVPHISSYSLTVEPRTALKKMIEKGNVAPVDEELSKVHYERMVEFLEAAGFVNYEFSNFGRAGYYSKNNTAYWFGKPYLGIGPSAHSFNGKNRQWNVSNNSLYIKAIDKAELPLQTETLSTTDRYNELVMTRLRTQWGIDLREVEDDFGPAFLRYLLDEAEPLLKQGMLLCRDRHLHVTPKGKFLSDGIAAQLFRLEE